MTIGEPRVGVKVRTMKYLHFGVGVRGEMTASVIILLV